MFEYLHHYTDTNFVFFFTTTCSLSVDSPPLNKKPKIEPSPPKNAHSDVPNSHSNAPSASSNACLSSNGHTSTDSSSILPPHPPSLTPSSALSQQQKSQVPPSSSHPQSHGGVLQNSISNHIIAQQVPHNSSTLAGIGSKDASDSRGSVIANHQPVLTQTNAGPVQTNSRGFIANNIGQPLQTDGQQIQNNNDVSCRFGAVYRVSKHILV